MRLKSCTGRGWRCQGEQWDEHTTILVWAELQRTPCLSPAKRGHSPQWVCFSICARNYFTACEADGNRSHPSAHAAVTLALAVFWLFFWRGHTAFPTTLCCPHRTPLPPFPPGSSPQLIKLEAVEELCSPELPPCPASSGAPLGGSTQSRQPLSGPHPAPLVSPGELQRKWEMTAVRGGETGSGGINPSIAGAFSQKTNLE